MGKYRNGHWFKTAVLMVAAGGLVIAGLVGLRSHDARTDPQRGAGLYDNDLLVYLEAITRIEEDALFLDNTASRTAIIQDSLKAYLVQNDPFSGYLTREEYELFKDSLDEKYVGIGLEVERNRDGDIVCKPYPDGPAAKAGVLSGDRLIEIDGVPVRGKSLFAIGVLARGAVGTTIRLSLITPAGTEKGVAVVRSAQHVESVFRRRYGAIDTIKIVAFTRETNSQLKTLVGEWESNKPMVIDLRGNSGGDLHAAIDAAKLFLRDGQNVVTIETRRGSRVYASNAASLPVNAPVILWQDGSTASAAEVFVAALTENGRAVSIGKKSYGKGTRQEIIELSDGSALVLTTGVLLTPKQHRIDGNGLTPVYELDGEPSLTDHYVRKVEALLGVGE